jgi:hypothetical protein
MPGRLAQASVGQGSPTDRWRRAALATVPRNVVLRRGTPGSPVLARA